MKRLYTNPQMRANGFYIQLKLSNALFGIGTCTLNEANLIISDGKQ